MRSSNLDVDITFRKYFILWLKLSSKSDMQKSAISLKSIILLAKFSLVTHKIYLSFVSELFQILALGKLNHLIINLLKIQTIEFIYL